MTDEHEVVQELLAGHVLHALDDEQAREAEVRIASHLPTCETCRSAAEGLRDVAGQLALAAPPRQPPRTLLPLLRRDVRAEGRRGRRRKNWAVAGAAAAALAGVVGWNVHLTGRVSDAALRQAQTREVLATVSHPSSRVVPLSRHTPSASGSVAAVFVPGRQLLYLLGSLPIPRSQHVYQVWLAQGDRFASAGTFLPDQGLVLLRIDLDPRGYDGVLITEEPVSGTRAPSSRQVGTASF